MKRIVNVVESDGDGLESLLGEYVQIWCGVFIYAGRLTGVNENDIVLGEAGIVYETGGLAAEEFSDFQPIKAKELFIRTAAIESYFLAPQLDKG